VLNVRAFFLLIYAYFLHHVAADNGVQMIINEVNPDVCICIYVYVRIYRKKTGLIDKGILFSEICESFTQPSS